MLDNLRSGMSGPRLWYRAVDGDYNLEHFINELEKDLESVQ